MFKVLSTFFILTLFSYTYTKLWGATLVYQPSEFNDSIPTVTLELKNYHFVDGNSTGYIVVGALVTGNPDYPNELASGKYNLSYDVEEETVTPISLRESTDEMILRQFIHGMGISSLYVMTTGDKSRNLPLYYFFSEIGNRDIIKGMHVEYLSGANQTVQINNIGQFINFNTEFLVKENLHEGKVIITCKECGSFSIEVDASYFKDNWIELVHPVKKDWKKLW